MSILTICGSSAKASSNRKLLDSITNHFSNDSFTKAIQLNKLPLFTADLDINPYPEIVKKWRSQVANSTGLLISTPVYIYNIPAVLKNALEWLTTAEGIAHKPCLPITYTPHPPRGEKAMQSLLWSLQALDMKIVGQLPLYKNEVYINDPGVLTGENSIQLIREGLQLLK